MLSLLSSSYVHRLPVIFLLLLFGVWSEAARWARDNVVPKSCSFGKPCVLPCHIREELSGIMWEFERMPVQWYPRSQVFHQHFRLKNRTFLNDSEALKGDCTLTIQDMKVEDEGIHKCTYKSKSGCEDVLYYNLSVYVPVEKVTIVRSGNWIICRSEQVHPEPRCRCSGASSNSTVHRDNQKLYSINCSTPLLHNVSQYRCTVSTSHNSKSATYTELPTIIVSGTETTLPCGNSSAPPKSILWNFNNSEVIVNQSCKDQHWEASERWGRFVKNLSESGSLSLKNLTQAYQGLFTCVTDTDTVSVHVRLEKKGFSILITAIVITALLTVLALGVYKCFQATSGTQSSEPQPRLPEGPPSAEPPLDRFRVVQVICGLLGLNSVLPWNFLVMALLYFTHHKNFSDQSWPFSLTVLVSQVAHLLSEVLCSYCVPRFTLRKHTTACLIGISLQFVVVLVSMLAVIGETFFGISMCALWLASLFSTMALHHLSVEVNLLPTSHRNSFANGQASAGIVASVFLIIFIAATGDVELSVLYFFVFAIALSLVALLSYFALLQLEFAKHYFIKQHQMKEESAVELLNLNNGNSKNDHEDTQSPDNYTSRRIKILHFFCVMLVQLFSFSVHPAITTGVHTTHSEMWGQFFIVVCCFFSFNLFNIFGQKVASVFQAHRRFRILFPILVVLHSAFIPLFMFCNVQPRTFLNVNTQLSNDIAFSVVMGLFSFSNGFLTHLTMFYLPNQEEEEGDSRPKIIGRALGSVIGALLSFAFRALI